MIFQGREKGAFPKQALVCQACCLLSSPLPLPIRLSGLGRGRLGDPKQLRSSMPELWLAANRLCLCWRLEMVVVVTGIHLVQT